jgi:hypothetical protein
VAFWATVVVVAVLVGYLLPNRRRSALTSPELRA